MSVPDPSPPSLGEGWRVIGQEIVPVGTPVLRAPPCLASDCICLSSSQQNLGFSGESELFEGGDGECHQGVSWNVLDMGLGDPPVWKGVNCLSLGLRIQGVPSPESTSLVEAFCSRGLGKWSTVPSAHSAEEGNVFPPGCGS